LSVQRFAIAGSLRVIGIQEGKIVGSPREVGRICFEIKRTGKTRINISDKVWIVFNFDTRRVQVAVLIANNIFIRSQNHLSPISGYGWCDHLVIIIKSHLVALCVRT
jgi:hypothetical protein